VAVGVLVTRIGTVALMLTGLSRDLAHFQALSAFLGVGFTTKESEQVLVHPVRRRIIRWLILLGNAGFVAAVSSIIPVFIGGEGGTMPFWAKLFWLCGGLVLLWAIAVSKWVDRWLSRAIGWALRHWTRLEVYDYQGLLQLGAGYTVCEIQVEVGDWVTGRSLVELRLGDEGVQVLGIRRADGEFVGAPTGRTYIRKGDKVVLYGKVEHLAELDRRHADTTGDMAHEQRVLEQSQVRRAQELGQRGVARNGEAGPGAVEANID
jgi:NhaP-type Na+/H+ and K+/H+ antiporter